jgi:hypothetical protein
MNKFVENLIVGLIVFLGAITLLFLICVLSSVLVMLLWNWLMPVIFHLPEISIWQAWGLSFLTSILFKSSSSSVFKDKKD